MKTSAAASAAALVLAATFLAGCRQGLYNQQKLRGYRSSAFYADGSGARALPAGTVPRGFLREDRALYAGVGPDGKFVPELPVPLSKELLARGRERYDIYCSPCHGRTGSGVGMIVRRGFKRPPSFHLDRLRAERAGYFFDVMTNGFGQMSSYAAQVTPEDRWAITAYVRALQLSQAAPSALLADADRKSVETAPKVPDLSRSGEGDVSAYPAEASRHRGPVENAPHGEKK